MEKLIEQPKKNSFSGKNDMQKLKFQSIADDRLIVNGTRKNILIKLIVFISKAVLAFSFQ